MSKPVTELVTVNPSGVQVKRSSGLCGFISAQRLIEQLGRADEFDKRYKIVALTFHDDGSIRYWLEHKE